MFSFKLNCLGLESFKYKIKDTKFLTNETSDNKNEKKLSEVWRDFKKIINSGNFKEERIINSKEIDIIEKILSEFHIKHWRDLRQYFNNSEIKSKEEKYVYIRIDKNMKIILYKQKEIYYPLLLDLHHLILGHSYFNLTKTYKWDYKDKREKLQLELNREYLINLEENYLMKSN